MIKTFEIPDKFYKYGEPVLTDYCKGDGEGLMYKQGGEQAYELAAAFGGSFDNQYSVISLLSPYILGWDIIDKERELVSVDINKRVVVVNIRDWDLCFNRILQRM